MPVKQIAATEFKPTFRGGDRLPAVAAVPVVIIEISCALTSCEFGQMVWSRKMRIPKFQ